jgi:hypothetical protein
MSQNPIEKNHFLQQNGGVPLDHLRRCVALITAPMSPVRREGRERLPGTWRRRTQVVAKARERLALAADTMARTLLDIAESAESEAVKLAAVKDALDRAGVPATAEIALEIKPYEELRMGIVGIATVPRHAHQPAFGHPADVIDAELVGSPSLEPPVSRPDSPPPAMPAPDREDPRPGYAAA